MQRYPTRKKKTLASLASSPSHFILRLSSLLVHSSALLGAFAGKCKMIDDKYHVAVNGDVMYCIANDK